MLRKALYPIIEPWLDDIAAFLDSQNITPTQLTLGSLALNFVTGWIFSGGALFFGTLFLLVCGFADMLESPLIKTTKKASKFDTFLACILYRYSDFFIFAGLSIHFAFAGQTLLLVLTLGTLAGAFATSYVKARAENLIKHCEAGFLDRTERIAVLALGTLIPPFLPFILSVLLLGTNATAIQRILYTQKVLNRKAAPGETKSRSKTPKS